MLVKHIGFQILLIRMSHSKDTFLTEEHSVNMPQFLLFHMWQVFIFLLVNFEKKTALNMRRAQLYQVKGEREWLV